MLPVKQWVYIVFLCLPVVLNSEIGTWIDDPVWSPDGSTIAYVNIDYFEGRGRTWLMDPDGTNYRPIK